MRILLAEDDALLGEGLCFGLQRLGFTVDWVKDGIAAELALKSEDLDALVLDLGLPRQDGLTVLRKLRQSGSNLPVLVLTARDTVDNRVEGLDLGADDYLIKPFDLMEVGARLRAICRRRSGRASPVIQHGKLAVDPAARTVTIDATPVMLSSQEFAVLEILLSHIGQIFSRRQLEQSLYGWDEGVESNALEVHIHHLRKKLGKELIRTVRGIGYTVPKAQLDGK